MEAAGVRLYFLLEHNYSFNSYSVMYIAYNLDMTSIHALETNFSKDNISRGLCTLVPFFKTCGYYIRVIA